MPDKGLLEYVGKITISSCRVVFVTAIASHILSDLIVNFVRNVISLPVHEI